MITVVRLASVSWPPTVGRRVLPGRLNSRKEREKKRKKKRKKQPPACSGEKKRITDTRYV